MLYSSLPFLKSHHKKETAMTWEKPDFIEINMSAEIGGYQDDFEERAPSQPRAVKQPIKPASTDEA
jgi:hypothetical protein